MTRSNETVLARQGLLDAFDALRKQVDALVVVGAQAVYLHTGDADVALAEYTTDGDLVIDPDLLSSEPMVQKAMVYAGFTQASRSDALGSWVSPAGVFVDLMVPDAVAGGGRRSVNVPPHDSKSMRKTRGLEGALIDKTKHVIEAIDRDTDPRQFSVWVAGPAALLVAKLHKISDRVANESRLNNKDAHDIYRLLRAVPTADFISTIRTLQGEEVSAQVTAEALTYLDQLFAQGPGALGSAMAGRAESVVGDPVQVAESVALLAQDLLLEHKSQNISVTVDIERFRAEQERLFDQNLDDPYFR